jgi:hypothetical protein
LYSVHLCWAVLIFFSETHQARFLQFFRRISPVLEKGEKIIFFTRPWVKETSTDNFQLQWYQDWDVDTLGGAKVVQYHIQTLTNAPFRHPIRNFFLIATNHRGEHNYNGPSTPRGMVDNVKNPNTYLLIVMAKWVFTLTPKLLIKLVHVSTCTQQVHISHLFLKKCSSHLYTLLPILFILLIFLH